ncbi:MAG TPA: transcriptional regulator [Pseudonocardiaceae bacterium]
MTEDWAAVATAITQRMAERGMTQQQLIDDSDVSKLIVGEIQNNSKQRKRSPRTLKALSTALGWHPDHLAAVLNHRSPPRLGEPVPRSDKDVPGHLVLIEHYLRHLLDRMESMDARLGRIESHAEIAVADAIRDHEQRPDR